MFAVAVEFLTNKYGADGERENAFGVSNAQAPVFFLSARTYTTRA